MCGFIVVTAYLGQFGLGENAAFRMQYIVAGTTFFTLGALFYFIVAGNIELENKDVERYTALLLPVGGDVLKWSFVAIAFVFADVAFAVVMCGVISSGLLFPLPNKATLLLIFAISSGAALVFIGMTSDSRKHASRKSFVYFGIFKALAEIAFLLIAEGPYLHLTYFYAAAFCVLNAYLSQQRSTARPKALASYFIVLGVVVFSGVFGVFFYGQLRPSIGGGTPVKVRILINAQRTTPELARVLQRSDGSLATVNLIVETETELLVGGGSTAGHYDELLRAKKELVEAVLMYDTRKQQPQ